jgi:general secretion pathway protein G
MKLRLIRRRAAQGFTLIELLLVLVILTALASVVVPLYARRATQAKFVQATTDISLLGTALSAFEVDNGRYPTSAEGLGALSVAPGGLTNWHGPYVDRPVLNDPWGNPYVYACPGTHNTDGYDLHSFGPHAQDGAEDNIDNWSAR